MFQWNRIEDPDVKSHGNQIAKVSLRGKKNQTKIIKQKITNQWINQTKKWKLSQFLISNHATESQYCHMGKYIIETEQRIQISMKL